MILLELDDFEGFFTLARSTAVDPLIQSYIDEYEATHIIQLLGVAVGQDLIDDIESPSTEQQRLLDAWFIQDSDCQKIRHSKGLKHFLLAAVFYEYITKEVVKDSQSGASTSEAETSNIITADNTFRFAEQRWNEALNTVDAIQWLCTTHAPDDYPDYEGIKFRPRFSALL